MGFDIACGNYAVRTELNCRSAGEGLPSWVGHPFVRELKRDGAISVGVHFGSRGLGHKIASHYTKLAGGKNAIDVQPAVLDANSDLGREYLIGMGFGGALRLCRPRAGRPHYRARLHAGRYHRFRAQSSQLRLEGEGQRRRPLRGAQGSDAARSRPARLRRRLDGRHLGHAEGQARGHGGWTSELDDPRLRTGNEPNQAAGKSRWIKGRKVSQGGGLVDENAWREAMCERGIILVGAGADEVPPVYRPLRDVLAAHQDTFDIELLPRIVVMAGSGEHDPYKD